MTYSLFNLMLFWEAQSKQNFASIKLALEIATSKEVNLVHKQKLIAAELRRSGLFDEEYINSSDEEEHNIIAWMLLMNLNNPKSKSQ